MMETDAAGSNTSSASPAAAVSRWIFAVSQRFQHLLDKSTPFVLRRWIAVAFFAFIYAIRVLLIHKFYVFSYALRIYILNLIAFLFPQEDPEIHGSTLPSRRSGEFWPFVRRLPEFKFWAFSKLKLEHLVIAKGQFQQERIKTLSSYVFSMQEQLLAFSVQQQEAVNVYWLSLLNNINSNSSL